MVNKKLIIEMLNFDVEKYQHYFSLYKNTDDFSDKMIYWNNMFSYSSSLNARKEMCVAFGYGLVYDENGKILDLQPR